MTSAQLTQVLIALAPYLVPPLLGLVVYLVKRAIEALPGAQRDEVARICGVLVQAAEQALPGTTGAEKKQAVIDDLHAILKASHLKVPPALVDAFIEAAVLTQHDGHAPAAPDPDDDPMGFHPAVPASPSPAQEQPAVVPPASRLRYR